MWWVLMMMCVCWGGGGCGCEGVFIYKFTSLSFRGFLIHHGIHSPIHDGDTGEQAVSIAMEKRSGKRKG